MLSEKDILRMLTSLGVLMEGHFLLTSGRHSGKYLQCAKIFEDSAKAEILCRELAGKFKNDHVTVVIGPAMGAVTMAYEVSRHLGCRNFFTERENGIMTLRRGFTLSPDDNVLLVEDVVTTGGSIKEVYEMVRASGANVAGIGAVVDRSLGRHGFKVRFESVIAIEVESWEKDSCPLCAGGAEAPYKPGSGGAK